MSKRLYEKRTGRNQGKRDVIAYHIRMSFPPGEVTPEKALELGRELAMRWTKGQHQFIVSTHTNTDNPHAHIIYNSVNLDCTGKYQDFKRSAIALRRVSDLICAEHGLSVIVKPKLSKGYNRAEYLAAKTKPNLLIDIQAKIQEGKGAGYEHWARIFNIKEMAKTLMFLSEVGIDSYDELVQKSSAASSEFSALTKNLKMVEGRMAEIAELQKYIGQYGKTRDAYAAYRKSGRSEKFFEENRDAITLHQAAKDHFDKHGFGKDNRLPSIASLRQEYAMLLAEKRKLYSGYRDAKTNMQELLVARSNADKILNVKPTAHEPTTHNRGNTHEI